MGIRLKTTINEIDEAMAEEHGRVTRLLIRALSIVGLRAVTEARTNAESTGRNYADRTSNLRSSTGYVIALDGRIVEQGGFEQLPPVTEEPSEKGSEIGRGMAIRLAKSNPHHAVLVIVAGMNYATYVANRGFNVLDSAEKLAERIAPQVLRQHLLMK